MPPYPAALAWLLSLTANIPNAKSTMSQMGHSRPMHSVPVPINVRCYFNSDIIIRRSEVTRMGWTGRAPAPDGTQSARGACQEKEHYHASRSYRSHSDRHPNRYGQEHTSHDWPRSARRHRVAREGLTRAHYIVACELGPRSRASASLPAVAE